MIRDKVILLVGLVCASLSTIINIIAGDILWTILAVLIAHLNWTCYKDLESREGGDKDV